MTSTRITVHEHGNVTLGIPLMATEQLTHLILPVLVLVTASLPVMEPPRFWQLLQVLQTPWRWEMLSF